jgi:phage virion morphogenesis protein
MTGIVFHHDISRLTHDLQALANPSLVDKAARAVGAYMIGEVQKHFKEQTLWDDSAMPASAAATARAGQTLLKTGALRDSYHPQTQGANVLIGSDLIYAAIHHAGGKAGRNHAATIAPRPVLGVNPRNERDIIDKITGVFMGALA